MLQLRRKVGLSFFTQHFNISTPLGMCLVEAAKKRDKAFSQNIYSLIGNEVVI